MSEAVKAFMEAAIAAEHTMAHTRTMEYRESLKLLSNDALHDLARSEPFNYAASDECLMRSNRAERIEKLKGVALAFVAIGIGIFILGVLAEYPDMVIVWGAIGLLYLLHCMGFGSGDVK